MAKLWAGRTASATAQLADDFNSSIRFDSRMARQDIEGSVAHAMMLARQGIITQEDCDAIVAGLGGILDDLTSGSLAIDPAAEDIHMFVEQVLTERIGDAGRRLHTARSRNDQVALDLRLYLRGQIAEMQKEIRDLLSAILAQAEAHRSTIMPGYTHLQRAQPITFGHHLLAYAMMLERDHARLADTAKRRDASPIGCCALAGTSYPTDRQWEARQLGFSSLCLNSLDGVSDRDYCIELLSACSALMMHLSRFSEELILWSSWEFGFVTLDDAYTTGSSIMPQKKNSDMAELCRGKTGRVYGDLMAVLTMLKGIPLAYNKDMQEDKEAVFDAVDTVRLCLGVFAPMIRTMHVHPEAMYTAARKGFLNATDVADYLTKKGMPFRDAYKLTGTLVADCIRAGTVLDEVPLETYRSYSPLFEEDLYGEISLEACVEKRTSAGGTGLASVEAQLEQVRQFLAEAE